MDFEVYVDHYYYFFLNFFITMQIKSQAIIEMYISPKTQIVCLRLFVS